MGKLGSIFTGPKVDEPEPLRPTPEADADTLGRARAEALREARRRRGYQSTVYGSVLGGGSATTQRPRLIG